MIQNGSAAGLKAYPPGQYLVPCLTKKEKDKSKQLDQLGRPLQVSKGKKEVEYVLLNVQWGNEVGILIIMSI